MEIGGEKEKKNGGKGEEFSEVFQSSGSTLQLLLLLLAWGG